MLVKKLKQELNKFSDETQIFIRVKDENDTIVLADFSKIISSNVLGFGFIVPVSKINKENSKNGK
ncbi:unclassified [Brachyspira pilosicoli WesB]|uniref:Unclassified n=1 Tax=Brachyspira pilosicoli WesB TaxID=1161918 RepID=K0JLN0_BRAPL|nr:hypothetical protein [Brachyspira pilosicoli]CCG57959.1 unclassified [Brachyspira pilosicoli WesB]